MAKTKTDKTVQVKESGKVKVTFEGMAVIELCQFLYNAVEYYQRELNDKGISTRNYQQHAAITLLFGLYQKHFSAGMIQDPMKLELTRTEAVLLWGVHQELNYQPYLLMNIFMKLHQKLS